jgi:hypothetical protein
MSRLYLHCSLCGRKQADGLLSRAAWGHLELDDGQALRVCAGCKASNGDWEERLWLLVASRGVAFDHGAFRFAQRPTSS